LKIVVSGIFLVLFLVSVFTGAFNVQSAKVNISSRGESVQAAGTDWWPMFHHDPSHTGTSTSTGPTTNNTLWNYTTGGWVLGCAVADGFVYAGSHDFKVYCLKAATGALVWNYTTGDIVWSCPAVVGGFVYSGSNDRKVYCLNATTGTLVWNYTTGDAVESEVAVVDGLVYVGSLDKAVYCLNATTGTLVWSYTTGGVIIDCPAVGGGLVYVGSGDWNIYCLNATTGTLVWSYTTGSGVDSCPAVVGGLVYVGGLDWKVYCLNATTGALVWNYTTGNYVDSSPAVVGGLVYVGSWDWNVYCLNATTGALVWNYTTGGVVWGSSPAVAGGFVYVGSNDTKVYCLNAVTGALVWNYKTGGLPGNPAVVDVVYVGSEDGVVYAFGEPVAVSLSPSSGIMDVGQSQQFTSTASGGTSPYTYQWYLNGTAISGATSSTYTFTTTSRGHYNVYVNVTDNVGIAATSNTATVTVNNTPSVTISPTSVTMNLGQSQLFNSSITGGTSPYTYQWYFNDVSVSSATSDSWTFTPTSTGSYTVHLNVTDNVGVIAISPATDVTVSPAIPEFQLLFFLPLFMIATLLSAILLRRKKHLTANRDLRRDK
jgi:outer membrane protein assembly factor BamB